MDSKKLLPLAYLNKLIRDSRGKISWLRVLILVLFVLPLIFYLIILYVLIKLTISIASSLFVRDEGRNIRGDGPLLRRQTLHRWFARAVDYIFLAVPLFLILAVVDWAVNINPESIGPPLFFIVGAIYFPVSNSITGGQSIGKSLFGLQVVSTVKTRSFGQLLFRELVSILFIISGLFPVSLYVMMKNKRYEQPADIVADTQVIQNGPTGVAGVSALINKDELKPSIIWGSSSSANSASVEENNIETRLQGDDNTTSLQTGATQSTGSYTTTQGGETQTGKGASDFENPESDTEVWDDNTCPNCERDFPSEATYCPNCGKEVSSSGTDD